MRVIAYPSLRPAPGTSSKQTSRSVFAGLLILLGLLSTLTGSGCTRRGEPDTLTIAIELPPRGFDPRFSSTNPQSARIMQLIYDTLVVKDQNFDLVPSLAESFEESPDRTSFTFRLRPGVRFHDGRPLTSADVRFTFESILAPEVRSPIRGAIDKIGSIETPDERTVVFRAREPFYTFPGNLPAIGIIPAGSGVEPGRSPIGTGQYRFVSYKEGELLRLEANTDYWGTPATIRRLRVKVVTDNSTRQAELMSGSVDLAYNAQFDPETIRALSGRRGMQVLVGNGTNVGYLGLNLTENSPLSNKAVRQAVAHAIDRDVIIHRLLRDQARRADAVLPPEHWAYDGDVQVREHDRAKAIELLAGQGLVDPDGAGPGSAVTLTLLTTTTQLSRNIASILQDQLRLAGIRLELLSLETATLFDRIGKGQFDMYYLISIGANQSTDIFQFVYHSRYLDPEFNETVARLRAAGEDRLSPLFATLDSILRRREYCPSAEVSRLAQAASNPALDPNQRKQFYLRIAGQLTDRGGQNRMRYCNPEVDQWIVEAEREPDRSARLELYRRIQVRVADELPQIYLWYPANTIVAGGRVRNLQVDPSGSWYFIGQLSLAD